MVMPAKTTCNDRGNLQDQSVLLVRDDWFTP